MTPSGIYQVVHDRARAAGLPAIHPHQLRHTFATSWLAEGGNENELMLVAGWKSRTMIDRYTKARRRWSGPGPAMPACLPPTGYRPGGNAPSRLPTCPKIGASASEDVRGQASQPGADTSASLAEMDGRALCYPAFSQVAPIHDWHRDGVDRTHPDQLAVAVDWRTLARCAVN